MFDDLAVLKPEEVGGHCAGVLGRGLDQPVGNDDVAVADHTLDLDTQFGELPGKPGDEADERIGTVGSLRIVLDVLRAEILLDGLPGLLGVECELVELNHGLLVALDVGHGGSISSWALNGGMRGAAARRR